jgi:hypothetical protein
MMHLPDTPRQEDLDGRTTCPNKRSSIVSCGSLRVAVVQVEFTSRFFEVKPLRNGEQPVLKVSRRLLFR